MTLPKQPLSPAKAPEPPQKPMSLSTGSRPGKRKLLLGICLAAVAVAAVLLAASQLSSRKAWKSFSQALDNAVGEGAWSSESHDFSFFSRTLTVKGLTFGDPPPPTSPQPSAGSSASPPQPPSGPSPSAAAGTPAGPPPDSSEDAAAGDPADSYEDAAAGTPADDASDAGADAPADGSETAGQASASAPPLPDGSSAKIQTLTIQGFPDQASLDRLFGGDVITAGPAAPLFKLVTVEGLTGSKTLSGLTSEYSFSFLQFTDLALKATETDLPKDTAGFLKSVSAGKIELAGYKSGFAAPAATGEDYDMSLERLVLASPALGEGFTDAGNYLDILRSLSLAELRISAFKAAAFTKGVKAFESEAGDLALLGLSAPGKAVSFSGSALAVSMKDPSLPDYTAFVRLDSFEASQLDLSMPVSRAADVADRLATPYYFPTPGRIWQDLPRVSDLFTPAFGCERGTLAGLSAGLLPGPQVKVTQAVLSGPFKAQELPQGTAEFTGIVYTPPEDLELMADSPLKLAAQFLPYLGQQALEMNLRLAFASSPEEGLYRVTLTELSAKGAGEFTGSAAVSGIRRELLPPLSMILLSDLPRLSLGQNLTDIGLMQAQINYSDRGLIPAAYAMLAEETGRDPADVREAVTANVTAQLIEALGGEEALTDPAPLTQGVASFLAAPQTFSVSALPDPPFSDSVYQALPKEPGAARNALNLSFSSNGEQPVPLRFNVTGQPSEDAP
ncbi:MAG: hypothetical protein LBW85_10330 [Deltaproteobacteria bacterium]|jgi:hypothetical protein|nr:hypothetical protein [Deltaproteobacteria bacterium]